MNNDLIQAIEQSMINQVKKTEFLDVPYSSRKPIPESFINQAWEGVNWEEVMKEVTIKLENRICNAIIGNMETEIKSDVKKLLSVDGVRQKLRMEVYPKLMAILKDNEE